jgi:ribonuclease-3
MNPSGPDGWAPSALEESLGYRFSDRTVLEAALTHRSFQAENTTAADNERLEFLGDAVLGLTVTTFLYDTFPTMSEGEMAKVRAAAVSRDELSAVAAEVGLHQFLRLGRGEEVTGGRAKSSILANAMEAVIGAVYLDSNLEQASAVVLSFWAERIRQRAQRPGGADHKTRLQEVLAAGGRAPLYVVEATGPDHRKQFFAEVQVGGKVRGQGSGASKREAEQEAARAALAALTSGELDS